MSGSEPEEVQPEDRATDEHPILAAAFEPLFPEAGEYIPARRIRDLWAGTLGETGECPKCHVVLGETHAQPCKWRETIVGSNEAEHWL